MNTKIPVKKLSEKVAASVDMPVDEVQSFIKILFDKIVDGLQQGESVTLPGLGRFVASSMPDEPVAFIPEREFSDAVNAPFVMFEPVPLNEGVTEEILDSVPDSETSESTQTTIVTEASDSIREQIVNSESGTNANDVSEVSTTATVINEDARMPSEDFGKDTIEVADATVEVCTDGGNSNVVSEPKQSIPDSGSEATQNGTDVSQNDAPINDASTTIQQDSSDDPSLFIPEDEEEYVEESRGNDKPRFLQGFVIGLVTGLAIGALALFAYMVYFINSPAVPVE